MNAAQDDDKGRNSILRPAETAEKSDFAAPLGTITGGRLVFASGAAGVTIRTESALPELYQAHFEHHLPRVWTRDGVVTISYRRFPFFDWLVYALREPLAELTLNDAIPWELEFREGVSRLAADLRRVQVPSLDVLGGASHVSLLLGSPDGTGFIHFAGGASDVTIRRPAGVAVRVQVGQGVSGLTLDEQQFGAIGGETRLATPDFPSAERRYDINIAGGASNLMIEREQTGSRSTER